MTSSGLTPFLFALLINTVATDECAALRRTGVWRGGASALIGRNGGAVHSSARIKRPWAYGQPKRMKMIGGPFKPFFGLSGVHFQVAGNIFDGADLRFAEGIARHGSAGSSAHKAHRHRADERPEDPKGRGSHSRLGPSIRRDLEVNRWYECAIYG